MVVETEIDATTSQIIIGDCCPPRSIQLHTTSVGQRAELEATLSSPTAIGVGSDHDDSCCNTG